jgi:5-oxoprolinase (ATP-hydrolysing) subunit A
MARPYVCRIRVMHETSVDLNADLGEEVTDDAALLSVVTSANVACGFHAGNPDIMRAVCDGAAARGVRVGAQVSYLDREGFGRRPMDVPSHVLTAQVAEQVGVLTAIAAAAGTVVSYLKPHGALYNRLVDDDEQAWAVLDGSGELPVLGLPGGVVLELAAAAGRAVWHEGFPDRAYVTSPDGDRRLMPRDQAGAVLHDPERIAVRAVLMADQVDSLCVHGDGPTAVEAARAVRAALESAGIELRPFT